MHERERVSNMKRRRTRGFVAFLAILMLVLSSVFSGAALAQRGGGGGGSAGLTADYLCQSVFTNQFRLVTEPVCSSNEQLIVVADEMPFEYCYSIYTGVMSAPLANGGCPRGSVSAVAEDQASFFVCYIQYTGQIRHMSTPDSSCPGTTAFFTDFRGDITKFACVEENLNLESCDVFPAGPQNEIRQIGPMPNTSGGFFDIQWQWVFDGNNSPTQACSTACDNASIEAALESLTGINDVVVTGGPIAGTVDAPIRIEFVGVDAQTDIIPQISIQAIANTINQSDDTVVDGSAAGPGLNNVMPGGMVEIYEAPAGTDPNDPGTYGPLVTSGATNAAGSFSATNLLEGDYVVCATGTDAIAPSCEIVTVFDDSQTLVNNVDLAGTITAEITDTAGANEVQQYDDSGIGPVTAGTYTLTFMNQTTAPALDFDADAETVEDALEALSTIGVGNVSVSGGPPSGGNLGPPMVVEFINDLGGQDVPALVVVNTGGGCLFCFYDLTTVTEGSGEIQTLTADARVSGGTFTLTYNNGMIESETGSLDWDATVEDIEIALNGLDSINENGGSVTVVSTDPDFLNPEDTPITKAPVEVNFSGVDGADTNVLEVDNTNLT